MHKLLLLFFLSLSTLLKAQQMDVLHYRFSIDLNDNNDTLYGKAEITVAAKATSALQFDLVQKGSNGKGMNVIQVEKDNQPCAFTQQNNKLVLPDSISNLGDTNVFRIVYKGVPDDGLIIAKNKFGDRTFFADNWPNRAHHWLPCNDRPDDKATFEFVVTAPSNYTVVSNGIKKKEEIYKSKKLTHWVEDTPLSTKVMVIGAARFAVKTYNNSPQNLSVSAWVYPQDSTKGFYDFAVAPEMVRFFASYVAPFPYNKLANVQSTTIFGGMENASCIFYDENLITGNRGIEATVAHEIAHQWFGDAASEKSFAHLWLSEGFATYLSDLYFEKKYGKSAAVKRLQKEREEVIAFAQTSMHAVVDSTTDLMSLLNANSYQKGAWFLHMLRNEVGDSVFQKIIQSYYNQFKGRNADTRDFESVAETISKKELTAFFNQWLYQPGIPVLRVKSYAAKGVLVLTVHQLQQNIKQFSLEIEITDANGKQQIFTPLVTGVTNIFKYPYEKSIKAVRLDPATKLLFKEAMAK